MFVNIRVSSFEKNHIQKLARFYQLPTATLLHVMVIRRRLPVPTPPLNLETFHQLSRVKSNLTQIKNAVIMGEIFPFDLAPLDSLARKTDVFRIALRNPLPLSRESSVKKEANSPKTCRIRFRATAQEKDELSLRVRHHGGSISGYVRKKILSHRLPERISSISQTSYRVLLQLQWRLNTIAHAINGKRLRTFDRRIFVDLEKAYQAISSELDDPFEVEP